MFKSEIQFSACRNHDLLCSITAMKNDNRIPDRIEAVVADIDFTLTVKNGPLPKETKEAFEILHAHGVRIGLGTGRQLTDQVLQSGRNWGLSFELDFFVGMNGGMVRDCQTGYAYQMDLMNEKDMTDILSALMPVIMERKIAVNAEGGGNEFCMNFGLYAADFAKRHGSPLIDCSGDIQTFTSKPCFKMLFRSKNRNDSEALRQRFLQSFPEHWQIVESFPGTLEVMQAGITKGSGLRKYAKEAGIPMEYIIAFGDNENDIPMLKEAGWGVCLANGSEPAKKAADAITEYDCQSGGAGRYLMDHYIHEKGWM